MVRVQTTRRVDDREHGRWLYAFLMRDIEPELVEEVDVLEMRYRAESTIDHAARMERYEKAFAEFDRTLKLITDAMTTSAASEKSKRRKKLHMEEAAEHDVEAKDAGSQLDSFDAHA